MNRFNTKLLLSAHSFDAKSIETCYPVNGIFRQIELVNRGSEPFNLRRHPTPHRNLAYHSANLWQV